MAVTVNRNGQKWETRTEQLGVQNFEGVDAEGTRTITTIPADAIGNERPIEIVYERWYSKELQMIVYSKHSDPRFGEQTYRLTNINRSEPDPSLFQVPTSYRIVNEPTFFNRTVVNQRATVERVSTSKISTGVETVSFNRFPRVIILPPEAIMTPCRSRPYAEGGIFIVIKTLFESRT